MRRVVKKPGTEPNTEKIVVTNIQGSKSYANSAQSEARLARATNTATHINVQKFTSGHTVGATQPTVTHLHVKAAPVVATGHNYRTPPTLERYHKNSAESFVQSQLQKATMDPSKILKKKPFGGSKKKKIASLSAIAASVLLISSFLAYQNLPTITLAMASKKSGIAAGVPKGIPSNFALSRNVSATDNRIVMNFSSRTDDRNITITGEKTDISPDTLLDQINKTGKGTNHAYTVAGLKINIISAGNADWIDGNVHYNISGNSGLSSEQIATIASSL